MANLTAATVCTYLSAVWGGLYSFITSATEAGTVLLWLHGCMT